MSAPNPSLDPTEIDHSYTSFPRFEKWSNLHVNDSRWDATLKKMDEFKAKDASLLSKARDVAKRAAAIDTGALEGLYNLDDGFTITVATQVGFWQNAFKAKEEKTRNLIEAQLSGYDQVIDLATKGAPMVEAWVRALHATLCAAQKTYYVLTEQGEQEHDLPLGEYKAHPNHVITKDGKVHPYAPVLRTPEEMRFLLNELSSDAFENAHPVIQAAFAHYSLVWIHPFPDGNGRTARALASVYTYRNGSIPFMVLMEHKTDYLAALRLADSGNLQAYVDFVFNRGIDAFQLVTESLRAAQYPSPTQGIDQAQRLHVTKGGYAHAQIDEVGFALLQTAHSKAIEFAKPYQEPKSPLRVSVDWHNSKYSNPSEAGQRKPANLNLPMLVVRFDSAPPAQAQITITFQFTVPVDAGPDDEVMLIASKSQPIPFSISSLLPRQTTVTQLKLTMFLEGVWGASLLELEKKGRESLQKSGFA